MTVKQYRKRPVVVSATRYDYAYFFEQDEATNDARQVALMEFMGAEQLRFRVTADGRMVLTIPTLEGDMEVSDGDLIIKGVKGEVYPCKPDIFALTYEECE